MPFSKSWSSFLGEWEVSGVTAIADTGLPLHGMGLSRSLELRLGAPTSDVVSTPGAEKEQDGSPG